MKHLNQATHATAIRHQFASDNQSGICPEVFDALAQANVGHVSSYGEDPWTKRAAQLVDQLFETKCKVFFVFNGTAANSLSIASLCDSFHTVFCHQYSHLETDECNAPCFFSGGINLITLPGKHGKLSPTTIKEAFQRRNDVHFTKPRAVSLTQATELGTLYSPDELFELGKTTKKLGLSLHMDGARFANAVASLEVTPKKLSWEAGVDVLSLGGTKNGMAMGEAVVFFNHELARHFEYRCKQAGQLASKMRFLAAQWVALLENNTWLRYATHANKMAGYLEKELRSIPQIKILYPRQANSVFAKISLPAIKKLHRRGWHFYTDVGPDGAARLMCSWDTKKEDIEALVADIKSQSVRI